MNTKLILAALMMSLSMAACGQREEAPAEATTAPPADTAPAEAMPPAEDTTMDSTAPADGTTPPADTAAEGDTTEPAPAQ